MCDVYCWHPRPDEDEHEASRRALAALMAPRPLLPETPGVQK